MLRQCAVVNHRTKSSIYELIFPLLTEISKLLLDDAVWRFHHTQPSMWANGIIFGQLPNQSSLFFFLLKEEGNCALGANI